MRSRLKKVHKVTGKPEIGSCGGKTHFGRSTRHGGRARLLPAPASGRMGPTKGGPAMETLSRGLSRRSFARILGTGLATAAFAPALAEAKGVTPVAPAETLVRLSANENPYGPSPAAFAAIQGAFDR